MESHLKPWMLWSAALGALGFGALALTHSSEVNASTRPMYFPMRLQSAPFPEEPQPGALVVIPPAFTSRRPFRLCLYFHGWHNAALNVAGDTDSQVSIGGRVRPASNLIQQLPADVLLVVAGLRLDVADSSAGQLSRNGGVAAYLDEVLRTLPDGLAPRRFADISHLSVMAHSGGYVAAATAIEQGVPALRSVVLLDALYGKVSVFSGWAERGGRIASIYTPSGGTAANSALLASRLLSRSGVLVDPAVGPMSLAALASATAVVKRTSLTHDGITRCYPREFWSAGW